MKKTKKRNSVDFDAEIGNEQAVKWNKEELNAVKDFIQRENSKRTAKQRLNTQLLSIKFEMEDYIESTNVTESKSIETFVKLFINALNITFRKFATSLDTTDGNLKKYISGERRFNTDLALKFGFFFHTPADLWLKVQLKNELEELKQDKENIKIYRKYDYKRVIS